MLKEYAEAFGVTGREKEIRDIIKKNVEGLGDAAVDKMGNLIVHKSGCGKRVMLDAHMDEVGFIVTHIKEDGGIKFAPVGGIDTRIIISKRVIFGRNKITGVIGAKPIHCQDEEQKQKPFPLSDLFIDIGTYSREETEKYIKLGDYAVFESDYVDMGEFIKCKALDDRVGCSIVTELLKGEYMHDLYGAFTVQEEIGDRGAAAAAYSINPDISLVFEGTTCSDISSDEKDYVTTPGMGPAVSIMDRTSAANRKLFKLIIETAEKNDIPYQLRRGIVGGNDAGSIHKSGEGCITATISVPTRYIHSPVCMISKSDYQYTLKLAELVLKRLEEVEL
jgi:putative aminopeptidase FrvX